ncbi:chitin synthase [Colletotrichum truncatum]|uniref:Chitin synthase n=1 Tax=Colletotrichum truncatum TaxID=5467 RepID=A0ACC3ZDH3_COLTU|nr:chitin synthase [Colletotrichum truncatum]KAF6794722.1 chitin synthase [Colletotrichum truncatum]
MVEGVLAKIVNSGSLSSAAEYLEELAALILCRRWHQDQIAKKVSEWRERLCDFLGLGDPDAEEKQTATAAVKKLPSPRSRISPPTDVTTTPCVPLKFEKRFGEKSRELHRPRVVVKEEIKKEDIPTSTIPIFNPTTRVTRSSAPKWKSDTVLHGFNRYARPKKVDSINRMVKEYLDAPFKPSEMEKSKTKTGFIYGFRLPKNHKLLDGGDCNMVKIGFSKDPRERMQAWQRQCGYEPDVLFNKETPHHVKMEKIIHRHLGNERMQEQVCPQCSRMHQEFFEIGADRAQAVVEMWTEWAKRRPFDENGRLTEYWHWRLKTVDLADPHCWEDFVNDKVKVHNKAKVKDEIKEEDVSLDSLLKQLTELRKLIEKCGVVETPA